MSVIAFIVAMARHPLVPNVVRQIDPLIMNKPINNSPF